MRREWIAGIAVLALGALPVAAEDRCQLSDTVAKCFDRYLPARDEAVNAEVAVQKAAEADELRAQPTGADTGGANLQSNTKNLLPLMALSALLGGKADEKAGTLTFDLNFLIPGTSKENARNAQLQAVVNTEPKVSEALSAKLPEAERDELVGKLQKNVGDLDDYQLVFTYNLSTRSFGRAFAQYARRFEALSHEAIVPAGPVPSSVALGALVAKFPDAFGEDAEETTFQDLPASIAGEALAIAESSARALAGFQTNATSAMKVAGLSTFDQLLDNQPQLHIDAHRAFRGPLAGADETSIKVTYEWSAVNFNASMSERCHRELDESGTGSPMVAECLGTFTEFVAANQGAIDQGQRFSFSGEYVDVPRLTVDTGLDGIAPIDFDGSRKLILSAGWSRNFVVGNDEPATLDVVAEYQDVSDDPLRRDRGLVTVTFTRKLGGVSVPIGIVYANHGEFLTDVDEQFSTHIGLRFNAFGKKDKK